MFELFDRRQEYSVRYGRLPHWHQTGVTYFVTFRTHDSVPTPLLASWHAERDLWLRKHDIDPTAGNWRTQLANLPDAEREYHRTFTREFMAYLDRGYGACALRNANIASLVAAAMKHFDGERYWLGDFVVMPNHVHAIVCLLTDSSVEQTCYSWKKFSAGEINRACNRQGRFWQAESFDHMVRTPEQFDYFRRYIAENPKKAKLKPGDYLHWIRPM